MALCAASCSRWSSWIRFWSSAIFVSFTSTGLLRHGRTCLGRSLLLLATRQPHNHDHQHGDSQDQPGLDVLRKKARRFRCFILNWLVHVFPLVLSFRSLFFTVPP